MFQITVLLFFLHWLQHLAELCFMLTAIFSMFLLFWGLNLYQTCQQQPITVILLCIVHILNRLRGLGLYLIFISYIY